MAKLRRISPARALALGVVLTIFTTTALTSNLSATSVAHADPPTAPWCPAASASSHNGTWNWTEMISRPGVVMCHTPQYQLTILDPSQGAKLRVVSQPTSDSYHGPDALYWKRSAQGWAQYIQGGGVTTPTSSKLFNVVNAGFLVDTSGTTTRLSMPEYRNGITQTPGWASLGSDPAWTQPKRFLRIGYPGSTPQSIGVGDFGNQNTGYYDQFTISNAFAGWTDGTVGFAPWTAPSDIWAWKPRSFVGYDFPTGKIYIMVATGTVLPENGVTLQEASNALYAAGADWLIQFDGGRSSQWYSPPLGYGWHVPGGFQRDVPEVLAVYSG